MRFFDFFLKVKAPEPKVYKCPFVIRSNVFPEPIGFRLLNQDEEMFLCEFERKLIEAKINPSNIVLTRLSSGVFNVDHVNCYVGKIGLRSEIVPDKYAVWRNGGKRALRVFESKKDAEQYKQDKNADTIEFRKGYVEAFYMQYFLDLDTVKEIRTLNAQDCIDAIPFWIRYIKRNEH